MYPPSKALVVGLALTVGVVATPNTGHAQDHDASFNPIVAAEALVQGGVLVIPAPPRHERVIIERRNGPVIASGIVTFGLAYGISAAVAASTESEANDRLYVPLAGPWLSLADRPDCPIEEERCDNETTKKILLVADGVMQAAGVLTTIYGVLNPIRTTTIAGAELSGLHIKPVTMNGGRGLALSGSF